MRTSFLFIAVAALAAACSDDHQPTSPNGISRRQHAPSGDIAAAPAQAAGQDAKPIDQVGYTKMQWYSTISSDVAVGGYGSVAVNCPAGTALAGGGYDVIPRGGGTTPVIYTLRPIGGGAATTWMVKFTNNQAGAATVAIMAYASCVS